jgi:pyrimidine-nucleoside phosphorylase
MRAVDLIRTKRDGGRLDRDQIEAFVSGVTGGAWPDYQVSALLMAIVLRGMDADETAWLTDAMVRSGARVVYRDLPAVPVDKHSTGGVGDKVSLVIAPLAAACGAPVPMMSGRGLGHTGGTLDKLQSIPGFRIDLSLDELQHALATVGCALIGQTDAIAPADRKLYALRDVTGTVESLPLIAASIMSKKIAEGIGGLVLDVKAGRGAFMKSVGDARRLAETLVAIGTRSRVRTEALVTDMDAPLGRAVGNALEVREALDTLRGRGPHDVETLSVLLAARMLVLAGVAAGNAAAEARVRDALSSGAGLEKLRQVIANQGGDPRVVDDDARLPSAPHRQAIVAPRDGYLTGLHAELIGRAAAALGAGRDRVEARIDPAVGAMVLARRGVRVQRGQPVLELHYRSASTLQAALPLATHAIEIGDEPPAPVPLVLETVASEDESPGRG